MSYADEVRSGLHPDNRYLMRAGGDPFAVPFSRPESVLWDPNLTTAVGPSSDPDELAALEDALPNWQRWGTLGVDGYPTFNRDTILRHLGALFHRDGPSSNVVGNYTWFINGTGFTIEDETESDERQDEIDEWVDEQELEDQIEEATSLTALYGEAFFVTYPLREGGGFGANSTAFGEEGPKEAPSDADAEGREIESVRVLDPFTIPKVASNPQDKREPWGYGLRSEADATLRWIHPADVVHLRFDCLGRTVHGRPVLLPAIVPITYLEKLAENRYYWNWMRTRFPIIRKLEGPSGAGIAKEMAKPVYQTVPKPGTVVFEKGPVSWQFPSANIGASDVAEDWRLLVLRIAAAVRLPEYLVLNDASNNNFASLLVAESPMHQMFQGLQRKVARAVKRVVSARFPAAKINVTPAPIMKRSPNEESEAFETDQRMGIVSRGTIARLRGYDWEGEEGEKAKILEERIMFPPPMLGFGEEPEMGKDEEEEEPPDRRRSARNGNGSPSRFAAR